MRRRSTVRAAARRAFTLVEVIIALVIIGVLGAIVGYSLTGMVGSAKVSATEASMKTVQGALKFYFTEYNTYPPTLQLLVDTRKLDELPKDGWGNLLEYYSPTTAFPYELISRGPDGLPQTADDINVHPTNPSTP